MTRNNILKNIVNWNRIDLLYINQVINWDNSALSYKKFYNPPFLLLEMTALKLLEMENSVED